MARRNWMPLYIPDFLADTMRLNAAETGAYLCLIMDYWLHDGLPDDDQKLASIARLPIKSWRQMRPTIEPFFRPGWRHKRIDAELAKMITKGEARRAAGSKGGIASTMARWNGGGNSSNASSKRQANVEQMLKQNVSKEPSKNQARVNHTTQERNITSTFSGAARDGPPREPVEISQYGTAEEIAEQARQALKKDSGIGSGELVAVMQAKGWVKP